MTDLRISYNIIQTRKYLSKFAPCKPRYVFMKCSCVCRNGLAFHVSVCLYYFKVLYFIGMSPKHEPGLKS